jgi:hypothetical protein
MMSAMPRAFNAPVPVVGQRLRKGRRAKPEPDGLELLAKAGAE